MQRMHLALQRSAPLSKRGERRVSRTCASTVRGQLWADDCRKTLMRQPDLLIHQRITKTSESRSQGHLIYRIYPKQVCAYTVYDLKWVDNKGLLLVYTSGKSELFSSHSLYKKVLNELLWKGTWRLSDDYSESPARFSSQLTPNEFSAETIRYQPCET